MHLAWPNRDPVSESLHQEYFEGVDVGSALTRGLADRNSSVMRRRAAVTLRGLGRG